MTGFGNVSIAVNNDRLIITSRCVIDVRPALEYESGPWDGVEGARYLMKEVMAALSRPFV